MKFKKKPLFSLSPKILPLLSRKSNSNNNSKSLKINNKKTKLKLFKVLLLTSWDHTQVRKAWLKGQSSNLELSSFTRSLLSLRWQRLKDLQKPASLPKLFPVDHMLPKQLPQQHQKRFLIYNSSWTSVKLNLKPRIIWWRLEIVKLRSSRKPSNNFSKKSLSWIKT